MRSGLKSVARARMPPRSDRMLAGVCGGIAEYFGVDATIVRILAVLLALAGGPGAILYGIDVPPYGGDTMFANQYLAYEALSPTMKKLLEGLRAVHSDIGTAGPHLGKNKERSTKYRDDDAWRETRAAFDTSFGIDSSEKVAVADIMAVTEMAPHLLDGFARGLPRVFVQVQNGCDHRCTFCIIPYGRGNSRSVPMGAVVDQVRALVERGHAEIVLTGVDLTSYGA